MTSVSSADVLHLHIQSQTDSKHILVGVTTTEFTTTMLAGGRKAVSPYLQHMNNAMVHYFGSCMLMDLVLQTTDAKPIIVDLHEKWTEADKAALHSHDKVP